MPKDFSGKQFTAKKRKDRTRFSGADLGSRKVPEFPPPRNPQFGEGRVLGPRELGLQFSPQLLSGPEAEYVPGWAGTTLIPTTSKPEFYLYWALTKLLGPREEGAWGYQVNLLGGRHNPGGAVADFVIYRERIDIVIRLQTYRFHFNTSPAQQALDREQFVRLHDRDLVVIDVYEQSFMHDPSGQAAIDIMLEAINEQWRLDPLTSGLTVGLG